MKETESNSEYKEFRKIWKHSEVQNAQKEPNNKHMVQHALQSMSKLFKHWRGRPGKNDWKPFLNGNRKIYKYIFLIDEVQIIIGQMKIRPPH